MTSGCRCLLVLLLTTSVLSAAPKQLNLNYTSMETETPHTKWGKPAAQGQLKALVLVVGTYQMRQVVELAQRFDFEINSSLTVPGFGTSISFSVLQAKLKPEDFKEHYSATLTKGQKYDVILLSGNAWDYLSAEARKQLVSRVKKGTGLVWLNPRPSGPDAWKFLPVAAWKDTEAVAFKDIEPHPLLRHLPLEMMPAIRVVAYEYKDELAMDRELEGTDQPPLILSGRHGKGRVHLITSSVTQSTVGTNRGTRVFECGIVPTYARQPAERTKFPWWDYYYGLVGQAMLDAAGRSSGVKISRAVAPKRATVDRIEGQIVSLTIDSEDAIDATLTATIRNATGQVVHENETATRLKAGKIRSSVKLPRLMPGDHVVDIRLANEAGQLDWRAVHVSVRGNLRIKDVAFDAPAWSTSQSATGRITLTGKQTESLTLDLQLLDGYGRLLQKVSQPVTAGGTLFDLPLAKALGPRGILRTTLTGDKGPIDHIEKRFIITVPREWNQFETMIWQAAPEDISSHLYGPYMQAYADMGCTMIVNQYNHQNYVDAFLDANLKMCSRIGGYGKGGLKLTDPNDEYGKRYTTDAAHWAKFGPPINMAGDESYAEAYERNQTEMTEVALAAYRKWLKEQFNDINTINARWQSDFKSIDEIVPPKLAQLQAVTGNFAAWSDLKTFVEEVFAFRYETIQKNMLKGDPYSRNSASGTQSAYTVYKSYNWWLLTQNGGFRALMGYGVGDQIRQQYSFTDIPQMFWVGYGKRGERLTNQIVDSMWNGGDGVGLFSGALFLDPDFGVNGAARGLKASIQYVRHGMARLLYESKYPFDPIGVHYSQRSTHGAAAIGRSQQMGATASGMVRDLIQSAGNESKYLSYEQIENGQLTTENFKLFLMNHSVAMSGKEAEAIRNYVRAGGIVLADFMPGIMDNSARMLPQGQLDDVFGIKRTLPTSPPKSDDGSNKAVKPIPAQVNAGAPDTPEGNIIETKSAEVFEPIVGLEVEEAKPFSIGTPCNAFAPELKYVHVRQKPESIDTPVTATDESTEGLDISIPAALPIMYVDTTVAPTTSRPLAIHKATKAPLFLVNRFGKGMAVLVNCDVFEQCGYFSRKRLSSEEIARRKTIGRNLIMSILAAAGCEPNTELIDAAGKPLAMQYQQSFVQGGNRYIRPRVLPEGTGRLKMKLRHKTHVFEMSSGIYLGHTDQFPVPSERTSPGMSYALLAYKPLKVQLEAADSVAAGSDLAIKLTVRAEGNAQPAMHVVRVTVKDPTGKVVAHYCVNAICKNGTGFLTIPFVKNDQPGSWTLTARDVATGLQTDHTVNVSKP